MKFLVRTLFVIGFIFTFSALFAQGPGDPNGGESGTDPGCDPGIAFCDCPPNANIPPCPVDGGVIALLAAGVGLGLKRRRDILKLREV